MYARYTTSIYGTTVKAWHPEFVWGGLRCCEGCGRTEDEAVQDLNDLRYTLILKLLEAELSVPEPAEAAAYLDLTE